MQNLTYKILDKHLIKGKLEAGEPIEIKMDQTLTQDATGTGFLCNSYNMSLNGFSTHAHKVG